MKNNFLTKILKLFVYSLVFPIARWHISNRFILAKNDPGLKEKPSFVWLITGKPFMYAQYLLNKIKFIYEDSIVQNYSRLIKKHYFEDYAYNNTINSFKYIENFKNGSGSIKELFDSSLLMKSIEITNGDSFLDCGCGTGKNTKEIMAYFPNSKVIAFDLSLHAIEFAQKMISSKNVEFFQCSATDLDFFKKFPDNGIDNILFANMFATILFGGIEETRKKRKQILKEAARIAKKNVILNENIGSETKIFIEQKYRALFYDNFYSYFEEIEKEGEILSTKKFLIFHKRTK